MHESTSFESYVGKRQGEWEKEEAFIVTSAQKIFYQSNWLEKLWTKFCCFTDLKLSVTYRKWQVFSADMY